MLSAVSELHSRLMVNLIIEEGSLGCLRVLIELLPDSTEPVQKKRQALKQRGYEKRATRHPGQFKFCLFWRHLAISLFGGLPKKRLYSRLNWESLAYPTIRHAVVASIRLDNISRLAS